MRENRKMKIVLGALSILLLCVFLINLVKNPIAQVQRITVALPEKVKPNPYVKSLLTDYEHNIRRLMAKAETPGLAIAIVRDTTVIYMKGFGVKEVGKKDSIDIHSVFRLASVSKCFAPILTGLLVQDGILSWNDPVTRYVPDFTLKSKENTDSLTIKHVLSHTTGLPYHTYTNLVEEGLELKIMLSRLKDVNLTDKPGETYSYQNVAYSLIAEVVRSATGKSYEQLMSERVFKPLGMQDASMSYDDILLNKNVARPHLHWRTGWRVTSINGTYYNVSPAGGINASISDMAQLMKGIMGSSYYFIQQKTLDAIFAPVVKAKSKNRNFRRWISPADSYYAMGWRVLNFKHDTLLYHGGYINGYRSELAINRKNKIGICVLSNGPGNVVDNSIPYFFRLYFDQRNSILQWEHEEAMKALEPDLTRR
jgi:beta-lactamase class C